MVPQFRKAPLALFVTSLFSGMATFSAVADEQDAHKHEDTEVIVITASPLARTALASAQPVTVMAGDSLRERQAHTLGETLSKEPGINATHFAGVASSPIIRGLDGPRVKITQNGLDSADVSRGSPDHAVTTETSVAQQIEILRGPATLLYGSGAIGGVVNVVDNRIAQDFVGGSEGFFGMNLNTASNLKDATVGFTADQNNMVWHADAFARRSEDYRVPSFTNTDGERIDRIENSFIDAEGLNLGVSYILDNGYFGVSYGRLQQQYGIPGHDHDHGHDDHGHDDHGLDEHGEPFADLWQNRFQVHGGWNDPMAGIKNIELRYGYTDYSHSEIEGDTVGTTFNNQQHELRLTATHEPIAGWDGAFGYHFIEQDQVAFGVEAHTPPTLTRTHGLFWLLERQFGKFNWQTGARYEEVSLNEYSFSPLSASVGVTYPLADDLLVSFNVSHAQRAPSANELLANGEHFATKTYELGLAYDIHEVSDHHLHIEPSSGQSTLEKSNNIDLGLHLDYRQFHMDWTAFYNRVDNFIYDDFSTFMSGDIAHDDHDEHTETDAHDHGEGLPVINYTQRDVELYGYELAAVWELNSAWQVSGFSDYIRARARDNHDNLPRIPAQRIGTELTYQADVWESKLSYTWNNKQTRVSTLEDTTASYGILDAQVNWFPQQLSQYNISLYMKAENLTDKLGFVHSSFLKDDAPIRGRNFSIGLRGEF